MPNPESPRTAPPNHARRLIVALVVALLALIGVTTASFAGTPGTSSGNGTYIGGLVFPGPEPIVVWNVPGTGKVGTCISARIDGPLHGPYKLAKTTNDATYAELFHLYGNSSESNVHLAELSALTSHKYDLKDKTMQWGYVTRGQGGMSTKDASAMLAQAAKLAGPYRVTITWPTADTKTTTKYTATVSVTSASGAAVPSATVSLTGTDVTLALSSVTTNSKGQASVGFQFPVGTSATGSIAGSVSSYTSLSVYASPGEQSMVTVGSPSIQTGKHSGPIVRTRDVHLIKIGKGDAAKTPVPGYTFQLTDSAGKIVRKAVVSGTAAKPADLGQLTVGAKYSVTETGVPSGATLYIPAAHVTTFTVTSGTSTVVVYASDPPIPHPTVATQVSLATAVVGERLNDHVVVTGDDGEAGVITARLYGPVTPGADGCATITLTQYTSTDFVSVAKPVPGDGAYDIDGPVITKAGCYGWAETLTLTLSGTAVQSPPTAPNESSLVTQPDVTTTVSSTSGAPGDQLADQVVVSGLNGESATLTATLYGPLATGAHGCASNTDATWRAAVTAQGDRLVVASTSQQLTGDGTVTTAPITVEDGGCYTFFELLTPTTTPTTTVRTPLGVPAESTLITAPVMPAPVLPTPPKPAPSTPGPTPLQLPTPVLPTPVKPSPESPHGATPPVAETGVPTADLVSLSLALFGGGGALLALVSLMGNGRRRRT